MIKNLPAIQETWVWSLGRGDLLEKGMATHTSIIAWRNLQTEELGRLQSMGSQGAGHDWAINTHLCWCFSYYKSTRVKINNSSTIKLSFWFHFFQWKYRCLSFHKFYCKIYIVCGFPLHPFIYWPSSHVVMYSSFNNTFNHLCSSLSYAL